MRILVSLLFWLLIVSIFSFNDQISFVISPNWCIVSVFGGIGFLVGGRWKQKIKIKWRGHARRG